MAKKDKAAKGAEKEVDTKGKKSKAAKGDSKDKAEKAPKEKTPEFKYGVSDLAEKLGIKEASVRVQLRNKGIDKNGKSYGWNSKADLDAVATKLKTVDESKEKKSKKDKAEDADAGKKDKKKKKSKKD